jgi:small subunit ribosomal protein S4
VKPGDEIRVRAAEGAVTAVALDASRVRTVPSWLAFNEEEKSAKILALPDREEMEAGVEEQLIVEFYSR